jgi:Nucleotidyltransferase/DNA polymerase involved in DNA repair
MRKIIHIDMDAFYASVEQRDDPSLRGRPVVVAWRGERSVVCAASYEARVFGVRSAMPAVRAERLCPQAVFVPPDFARYKAVSRQVREIFLRHTDLVEPLSLDEAYLDVTAPKSGLPTATAVAETIRTQIREETQLTASAGVAPNKFLAKIASDWRKPDGQFVLRPHQVEAFLTPLPVERIPGVGKVMQGKLNAAGIHTVGDLRAYSQHDLEARYGNFGAACTGAPAASTSARWNRTSRCSRSRPKTRSPPTCCCPNWNRTSCASPKRRGPPVARRNASAARWC